MLTLLWRANIHYVEGYILVVHYNFQFSAVPKVTIETLYPRIFEILVKYRVSLEGGRGVVKLLTRSMARKGEIVPSLNTVYKLSRFLGKEEYYMLPTIYYAHNDYHILAD